ncbi:MAG: TonB-dependent receptor, partial [Bacteroidota bacterium]
MNWLRFLVIVFLVIPLFAVTVVAQTGEINGRVVDDQEMALPFANVLIEGTFMGAATNVDGEYSITNVPPGSYTVRASVVGYRTETAAVTVRVDETASRHFTLAEDFLRLEEVVVTGTRTPRMKLESTVAISTISPRELEQAAPRSTTEVLRYVPGFTRVESSGGEVNQNITVRGIYGVELVAFLEDGMPVFPTMHTFFMNADNLFRPDENIASVEVVRGGNSALYGSSTPGAVINFLNKTGGPEVGGILKVTGATGGLVRYDANINGPLGDDWRFNLGGFYRFDRGVRDPGFPGIRGGQFKANITRLLDKGYVRASLKLIDDRNQFILPLPFENPDDPDYVEGFSDFGSMNTIEANRLRIPLPQQNGELELPLDDGIRTKASWLTAEVSFDFGNDWNVHNTAQVMENDQSWNALLAFDIVPFDVEGQSVLDALIADGTVPAGSGFEWLFTNHLDPLGNKTVFDTRNGLVAPSGLWHVEKPLTAFHDQLIVTK